MRYLKTYSKGFSNRVIFRADAAIKNTFSEFSIPSIGVQSLMISRINFRQSSAFLIQNFHGNVGCILGLELDIYITRGRIWKNGENFHQGRHNFIDSRPRRGEGVVIYIRDIPTINSSVKFCQNHGVGPKFNALNRSYWKINSGRIV